jgi:hypothetical protein
METTMRLSRMRVVVGGLLAVAALGCERSELNPTDTVLVSGSARAADGSALANVKLLIHRGSNSACGGLELYREVTTDEGGDWSFTILGADTQNGSFARCFELRLALPGAEAAVHTKFVIQRTRIEVPELRLWSGGLTVEGSGADRTLAWESLAASHGIVTSELLSLEAATGTAWQTPVTASPLALTASLLEDFTGLKVQLAAEHRSDPAGTKFDTRWVTDALAVAPGTALPVSRGARCQLGTRLYDADCPFTDGKLAEVEGGSAADLRVNLISSTKLRTAVVRGLRYNVGATVVFEGSADGGINWLRLAELSGAAAQYAEVALAATPTPLIAFRLRVEGDGGPKLLALRELSLFP